MIRFLLAWAGACWLLFELVPTKLPHYVLPAYPPLVMLAALWILAPRDETAPRWQAVAGGAAAVQFAIGLAALVAAPIVAPHFYAAARKDGWSRSPRSAARWDWPRSRRAGGAGRSWPRPSGSVPP
ncbi:MAG: hypothetical protein WDM81_02170 [Rhizomicrobium sp.]